MWFYHGRRSLVEFRSGNEDRNCANKATALDQWMYTYTQNRILHHEDYPARSLYPWKSSQETRLLFKNFGISVDDQGNGLANKQWILVLWLRLNSVLLANQIELLDMFWLFDGRIKNILYFREFVNQLFKVWPTCRQEVPRELGGRESRSESKKEEWRSFLSLSLTLQKSAVYQNFTSPRKKKLIVKIGNNNF